MDEALERLNTGLFHSRMFAVKPGIKLHRMLQRLVEPTRNRGNPSINERTNHREVPVHVWLCRSDR